MERSGRQVLLPLDLEQVQHLKLVRLHVGTMVRMVTLQL
jgi:hypothetical protein